MHTFCQGSPLTYYILEADGNVRKQLLGPVTSESAPLMVTSSTEAKGALLEAGEYCLLTEVVAAGFCVSDVEMVTLPQLKSICKDWESCANLLCPVKSEDGFVAAKELYSDEQFYKGV